MTQPLISDAHVDTFARDGVVRVRGLFADHVATLPAGVDRNLTSPGRYAAEYLLAHEAGRFFDDYCNWSRIPEFEEVVHNSPAATVAADDAEVDN